MKVARVAGVSAGLLLSAVVFACGPSFQVIYEGNARFEHCYALEENPQAPMKDKSDCWRDWSEHYTYGQTRDRIHYATARYVALSQAPNVPTDEAMMMAAPGMTPRATTITAPAPTNAFAPPPKVLELDAQAPTTTGVIGGPRTATAEVPVLGGAPLPGGGSAGAPSNSAPALAPVAPAPAPAPLPAATCADDCARRFRDCNLADAGARAACDKTYRGCMRGCFK